MGCMLATMGLERVFVRNDAKCKEEPKITIDNATDVEVLIWVNGGGPLARVDAHSRMDVTAPRHLAGSQQRWKATCALLPWRHGTSAERIAIEVKSWQFKPRQVGTKDARTLTIAHACGMTVRELSVVVSAQRAFRGRRLERKIAAAEALAKARAAAALTIQARARGRLARARAPCPICLEEMPWLAMGAPARGSKCHRVCSACAAQYVDTSLREGRLYVRCPGGDCSTLLSPADLRRLSSARAFEHYTDALAATHAGRLLEEGDKSFVGWCREHARQCPACTVVIWRSVGCDSMMCRCGRAFNWSSEEAQIKVGNAERADGAAEGNEEKTMTQAARTVVPRMCAARPAASA